VLVLVEGYEASDEGIGSRTCAGKFIPSPEFYQCYVEEDEEEEGLQGKEDHECSHITIRLYGEHSQTSYLPSSVDSYMPFKLKCAL